MIIIRKLNEYLSGFDYRLPDDPELILYDFYFLTTYGNDIETNMPEADFAIKEASDKIVESLHAHMLKAVKYALCSEIRHIFDGLRDIESLEELAKMDKKINRFVNSYSRNYELSTGIDLTNRELRGVLTKETESSRLASYEAIIETQKELNMTNMELAKIFSSLFLELDWKRDYGGRAWDMIVDGYKMLLKAKRKNEKIIAIDHTYDLQHNTDTVFNKLQIYYKDSSGYGWIRRALNWKKDVEDIRFFYEKVSPQLRRIVAFIAYNVYGLTMEDKSYQHRVWTGGIWAGGTWNDGIWKNGIWKDGTWNDGAWINGTWEKGAWRNGIWKNGIWQNGTWELGTWENGTWEYGIWENGTWKYGTWFYGTWKNGTWEDGEWKDGVWEYGVWKNGVWKYGTWYNGTWENGTRESGTWLEGVWKNGVWEDGTWLYGVWKDGVWNDGIWENGIWEDGIWRNGAWEGGKIWNPKTREYEYSNKNPYKCEWSLSYRKER